MTIDSAMLAKLYKAYDIQTLAVYDSIGTASVVAICDYIRGHYSVEFAVSYKSEDVTISSKHVDMALLCMKVPGKAMLDIETCFDSINAIYAKALDITGLELDIQGYNTESENVQFDYYDEKTKTYNMYSGMAVLYIARGYFGGKPI